MSNRLPRILIADDEPDHRMLLILHLPSDKVRVVEACDGAQAIQRYIVARAIGDPYDLVILDGVMPEKNGFQVAEEIRQGDDEVKIAFLTADHTGVAPMRASLIHSVAFWRKPIEGAAVAKEIMQLVGAA